MKTPRILTAQRKCPRWLAYLIGGNYGYHIGSTGPSGWHYGRLLRPLHALDRGWIFGWGRAARRTFRKLCPR